MDSRDGKSVLSDVQGRGWVERRVPILNRSLGLGQYLKRDQGAGTSILRGSRSPNLNGFNSISNSLRPKAAHPSEGGIATPGLNIGESKLVLALPGVHPWVVSTLSLYDEARLA